MRRLRRYARKECCKATTKARRSCRNKATRFPLPHSHAPLALCEGHWKDYEPEPVQLVLPF